MTKRREMVLTGKGRLEREEVLSREEIKGFRNEEAGGGIRSK